TDSGLTKPPTVCSEVARYWAEAAAENASSSAMENVLPMCMPSSQKVLQVKVCPESGLACLVDRRNHAEDRHTGEHADRAAGQERQHARQAIERAAQRRD